MLYVLVGFVSRLDAAFVFCAAAEKRMGRS